MVKIGTGVLTGDGQIFAEIAGQCAAMARDGRKVVMVSSGAIALGVKRLGYPNRPKTMDALQACAAVGQGHLIRLWDDAFVSHGIPVAQVLLTHADLADRKRFGNAQRALAELLNRGAIPVINENDTVAVEEIAFGDNDALSAQVANLVGADVLVMLSVASALLDGETRVPEVQPHDRSVEKFIRVDKSSVGTGGMVTKVRAAQSAAARGTAAIIAAGTSPKVLERLMLGEDVGTFFHPATDRLASRAHWIAHTLRPKGTLVVDDGAKTAVTRQHRSLLPSGIVEVRGDFDQGDPIELIVTGGPPFAQGLAIYSSSELRTLCGHKGTEILELLGYHLGDAAIHKDDLVVFK